jgi:hypothetical protein
VAWFLPAGRRQVMLLTACGCIRTALAFAVLGFRAGQVRAEPKMTRLAINAT